MIRYCRTNRHRGVSLIELLVIMSAASFILSLSAGLIHRLMHAEAKSRSLAAIQRTSLRLADEFRRDVHGAGRAVVDGSRLPAGVLIRLESSGGQRIDYRRDAQAIHKLQLRGEQVIARQQFDFPVDFDLRIEIEGTRLIALTATI